MHSPNGTWLTVIFWSFWKLDTSPSLVVNISILTFSDLVDVIGNDMKGFVEKSNEGATSPPEYLLEGVSSKFNVLIVCR